MKQPSVRLHCCIMASKRKRGDTSGDVYSLECSTEEEVQGLLSNLRNVFAETFVHISQTGPPLEQTNVELREKAERLENEIKVLAAGYLDQASKFNALQKEYNELLNKQNVDGNTAVLAELAALEEIVAQLEAENFSLRAQGVQLRAQQAASMAKSEADMSELTLKYRRLQADTAWFRTSLDSATGREDKLKQAHHGVNELNIRLMDDIRVLNNQGQAMQQELGTLRDEAEERERKIKELEILVNSLTPMDGTLGGCWAMSAPEIASFQEQYAQMNPEDSASHSEDESPVSLSTCGNRCPPALQLALPPELRTLPAISRTHAGSQSQAVLSVPGTPMSCPPAAPAPCSVSDVEPLSSQRRQPYQLLITRSTKAFLVSTAPYCVPRMVMMELVDQYGRVAVCTSNCKGMQYYVEYFTPEEAINAITQLRNAEVDGHPIMCQCVVTGTRMADLVATHSVFVQCLSTAEDVMQTAQLNGTVNYLARAGSRRRYVVEYENETSAILALQNSLEYSCAGHPFVCEPYYPPVPHGGLQADTSKAFQTPTSYHGMVQKPAKKVHKAYTARKAKLRGGTNQNANKRPYSNQNANNR